MIAEISIKLGLALLSGIVLGMNRWIHHKSAGVRTHSLVALGAALLMLLIAGFPGFDAQAVSRVSFSSRRFACGLRHKKTPALGSTGVVL